MKLVGLTGGIGSGKSTVAQLLSELGAYIIDADELARRIVEPGRPAWKEIKKIFGAGVLNPDQTLDRKKLAEIVFTSPDLRKKLERVTHPQIGKEILLELEKAKKAKVRLAVLDAALLMESPLARGIKPLILVVADEEIRVQRVCHRDQCDPGEVRARIRNQLSDSDRLKKADFIIQNNADLDRLKKDVKELYQKLVQQ